MFCSHCGKEIPDDSVKCPDCGAEVKRAEPEKKTNFLEEMHPCTLTALLLSALIVIFTIFNIVFLARNNPTVFITPLLYCGVAAFILTLFGYRKSEKKPLDKLLHLICIGCAMLAILMVLISYIVYMALFF